MSLSKAYVDGFLVKWEAGEYAADVRMLAQRSRKLEVEVGGAPVSQDRSTGARAQAIRDRLARTVKRSPEVMVKITSACRGMRQIGKHIDYISRKGELELEDQDGLVLKGREELRDLASDWRINSPEEIGTKSERRDTLNIVFSMPAFTDEVSMKRAVRAFAAHEFDGHSYVFAYHTQATDPDPNPPAHPHVHLSVKTQGHSGRRLNPRKADLQRWREGFASELRAHGIEANATSRLARLNRGKGPSRGKIAVMERQRPAPQRPDAKPDALKETRGRRLEDDRRAYYQTLAKVLSRSESAGDRALADDLAYHLGRDGLARRRVELER
ncbi:MAG TPA: hypothetical protein VN112_05685 [Ensifer sp.]|nr:hypothetical protein [Ensifer sp.]